jgi:hypothetical protein
VPRRQAFLLGQCRAPDLLTLHRSRPVNGLHDGLLVALGQAREQLDKEIFAVLHGAAPCNLKGRDAHAPGMEAALSAWLVLTPLGTERTSSERRFLLGSSADGSAREAGGDKRYGRQHAGERRYPGSRRGA